MLKVIRAILQKFIDDIDADNTELSYEQQCDIIKILSNVDIGKDNEMNKTQAADYLGVSRATFDNYVHDGFIPKGKQVGSFKELRWYKSDLDLFLMK
jgi:predicted DNA-binding transcriptional regulator AlpA